MSKGWLVRLLPRSSCIFPHLHTLVDRVGHRDGYESF